MSRPGRTLGVAALLTVALLVTPAGASGAKLHAGAGRADITPPTGYFMMGWVRSDAKTIGQHTRLFARALVLRRGDRKLALVSEDLNAIPGGMVKDATKLLEDRGFSERNVIVSASHTHAAPTGFYNFGTYNTVFPTAGTLTDFKITDTAADPQLYGFMVRQLARAIRRADNDLAPAKAGWGSSELLGLTQNRSLEAHLANHGIVRAPGQGSVDEDPKSYRHTIDPRVDVLRVDKVRGGRQIPIGIWSTFADHGTVNKHTFTYYNADHHGSATRVVERELRRRGRVPSGQEVVNAYGNTDEGDISAGLDRGGPAAADFVGRREAEAMLEAWREAGARLTRRPGLNWRWTRACFCGQETEGGGAIDSSPAVGLPLLTGSEEGRGPLYDITGVPFEGLRSPVSLGPQGHKLVAFPGAIAGAPTAVPLSATRIGGRAIVTVPGEMTADMGRRVRAAALASAGPKVSRVVISGLANEYVQYFTTPEEYERQHYEGGSTLFGTYSSYLIRDELAELTRRLATGRSAPDPFGFDPTNGVEPNFTPFAPGASSAAPATEPTATPRLGQASFRWQGGERGFDRPLDAPFVSVQRRSGGRWQTNWRDLGLRILWRVDPDGTYQALWEVPRHARPGRYRFLITANRYRLPSSPFEVAGSTGPRPEEPLTFVP